MVENKFMYSINAFLNKTISEYKGDTNDIPDIIANGGRREFGSILFSSIRVDGNR